MLTKVSLLGILLSPVVAQFMIDSIRPDVSFNDENDRFDVTSMLNKKAFRETPVMEEMDDEEADDDFRRNYHSGERYEPLLDILTRKNAPEMFLYRKADGGFAYDDRMDSSEGGNVDDFERNLKAFKNIKANRRNMDYLDYTHGYRRYRRSIKPDPVDEIMLQHAVPIVMKIDGYLKAPLK